MRAALLLPLVAARQRLIVDTDMGLDIDDVAALCIANALHRSGEAELLAVVHNTGFAKGVGGISAVNHWYGHDDIPIGAFKGSFGKNECRGCAGSGGQDQYLTDLVNTYNPPVRDYHQVPSALSVYRAVLAAQPDKSVNIASIGMLTNLRDLALSGPDQFSSFSGKELIARKVDRIVYMDGPYNFKCAKGMIGDAADCWSSSRDAVYNMPYSYITQLFSVLGGDIISGKRMFVASACPNAQGSPCQRAFWLWDGPNGGGRNGRLSWDPVVVLLAVRGLSGAHARSHSVNVYVEPDGSETCPLSSNPHQHRVDYAGSVQGVLTYDIDNLLCAAHPADYPSVAGMTPLESMASAGAGPAMSGYGGGDYNAAWDGHTGTFYDYYTENGGWTEGRLTVASAIHHVEYYPRNEFLDRMVGGRFVAILQDGSQVELAVISRMPKAGWNGLNVDSKGAVSAIRYESPGNSFGNIAEIKAYSSVTVV